MIALRPAATPEIRHLRDLACGQLAASSARALFVPGRIEVLGKHTDYCGGRSLVCAIDRGICLAWSARRDSRLLIHSLDLDQHAAFDLDPALSPAKGHWSNYPMTVARRLVRNFGPLGGADVVMVGNLPRAAGLSSSSALVTGITLMLADVNHLDQRPRWHDNIRSKMDLAAYLGTIENGRGFGALEGDSGVGTFGGSQDHTAIVCGQEGVLSQFAFGPIRLEREVPMPPGHVFVIASTGVLAEKTGAALEKYNAVSRRATAILELWNQACHRSDPSLAQALDSSPDAPEHLRVVLHEAHHPDFTAGELQSRLEQHVSESRIIIPQAVQSLAAGDLREFGRLVQHSQELAETHLRNQVPETSYLAAAALEAGAVAASAFGAGFGGAVWAMTPVTSAAQMLQRWSDEYRKRFPQAHEASFFVTRPSHGVCYLDNA